MINSYRPTKWFHFRYLLYIRLCYSILNNFGEPNSNTIIWKSTNLIYQKENSNLRRFRGRMPEHEMFKVPVPLHSRIKVIWFPSRSRSPHPLSPSSRMSKYAIQAQWGRTNKNPHRQFNLLVSSGTCFSCFGVDFYSFQVFHNSVLRWYRF